MTIYWWFIVLWEFFFKLNFVSPMMLNLLVNLRVPIFLIIFIGYELTRIMLYHILSWCCHYLGLFIHSKRKGGHKLVWIIHQDNSNHFTLIFRDNYSEYEDHMDISKLILKDPLEKQVTPASSSFHLKGSLGRFPFLFCLNSFKSKCEIFLSF